MAELTQEQIDELIAQKVSEARVGLFTEEDLNKKVTSEVDRRVESGIQKGLETQRQKWEREYAERANLSAEELAKKQFEEKVQTVTKKELEIQKKANKIEAKDMLSEAEIPKAQYDNFLEILVSEDPEVTKANVQNFITMFNNTKTEIETKVKTSYSNVPAPKTGNGDGIVTKADFNKMGYSEKVAFKQKNPILYKEFIS